MASETIYVDGVHDLSTLDTEDLNKLLIWITETEGGSDLIIKSSEPPYAKINDQMRTIGDTFVIPEHVSNLLTQIHSNAAVARLQGGEDLNFRYQVSVKRGVRYGFRVNAFPGVANRTDLGIKITFRAIPSTAPAFDDLGFEDLIREYCLPDYGLVLVSGPTGSGKSTSLASIIRRRLEERPDNIQTFESPIEFVHDNLPKKKGLCFHSEIPLHVKSFPEAIAAMLRMAPDAALIGEARGQESVGGLIRASITGHAVYSTTHTNSVPMSIQRLADEFPRETQWSIIVDLIDAMRLLFHQRLVRRPDGGRVALREILVFTEEVRQTLMNSDLDNYVQVMRRLLDEQGQPLITDLENKYQEGLVAETEYTRLKQTLGQPDLV